MTRFNSVPKGYEGQIDSNRPPKECGMFRFEIPGELPTMNEIIEASKQHWSRYKRLKEEHQDKVEYYVMQAGVPFFESCELEITYYRKDRQVDPDNISAGGRKIILDALEEIGCIENDGWKQIKGFAERWEVDKDNPRTEVVLKEGGGGEDNE